MLLSGAAKLLVWVVWLSPLAWLLWGAVANQLGPNPAEALIRSTGDWALRALWIALAVTPLRWLTGVSAWARMRRLWGLFAFFYAALHMLCYWWLDMGGSVRDVLSDVWQRPFILVGMLALLGLLALALTSPAAVVRLVGGRRWKRVHQSVYAIALLALLHFYWMRAGKNDTAEVAVYGICLLVLLGMRAVRWWRQSPSAPDA